MRRVDVEMVADTFLVRRIEIKLDVRLWPAGRSLPGTRARFGGAASFFLSAEAASRCSRSSSTVLDGFLATESLFRGSLTGKSGGGGGGGGLGRRVVYVELFLLHPRPRPLRRPRSTPRQARAPWGMHPFLPGFRWRIFLDHHERLLALAFVPFEVLEMAWNQSVDWLSAQTVGRGTWKE